MTDQQAKQLYGGALVAGLLPLIAFLVVGASPIPFLVAGLVVLGLIGAMAWIAYRRGRRWFAYGVLGGYGLLTLMSAGECTLLLESTGSGASVGFFGYPMLLMVALIVLAVLVAMRNRRRGNGGQE